MIDISLKKDETSLKEIKNIFPENSKFNDYDLFIIPSYCYKTKFPNHKENKNLILDRISEMDFGSGCFHNLTKEDFTIPKSHNRLYAEIFLPNLFEVSKPFIEITKVNNVSFFFFQYQPNNVDQTFLHHHLSGNQKSNTIFSGTYFLELHDPNDGIIFFDPNEQVGYRPIIEEGDVIFFDPSLPHVGPKTKYAKTVITFNYYMD